MQNQSSRAARPMRSKVALAGLTACLGVAGCVAVFWTETMAYGDLPIARLDNLVGVKGTCCIPGPKTECASLAPFACSSSGSECSGQTSAFDTCGSPNCHDSDDDDDACDSGGLGSNSVSVTTCSSIEGYVVVCGTNGTHCAFTTSSATIDAPSCGYSKVCGTTSGAACQ